MSLPDSVDGAAVYAVADCGGTHTRLELWRGDELLATETLGSANTATTTPDEARRIYGELIGHIADRVTDPIETYVATAGFDDPTADLLAEMFAGAVRERHYLGRVHIFNDILPLLFAEEPGTESVAAIIGTGSAYWSRDSQDVVARVGGVEWVASDDGAAVDVGRRGLVAMVRAADGRGERTSITARAGLDDAGALRLAREAGQDSRPKQLLAPLARAVTQAWTEDDDAVAGRIMIAVVDQVEESFAAAARNLGSPASATWVICGGLVSGCLPYQRLVLDACARASGGAADVRVVENALDSLRSFAARGCAVRVGARYRRTVMS
ncbi:BadF/BadG/BcrA/BcrD ATPase family protein [Austwickia chelonae]|uniref:BadF/BadG/BcrA/BcrD ATPase family protein n=1 Tax=Austwickia chelonae TaxID=100225 RepID=UPI0013C347F6|nr:BadF/BadG/BcrA/BcrD ATPase family protein [Austwickia chelonae]